MTEGKFLHLDDYCTPILTRIESPVPVDEPLPAVRSIVPPPGVARWPPASCPTQLWTRASLFAEHCRRLLRDVPMTYVQSYCGKCLRTRHCKMKEWDCCACCRSPPRGIYTFCTTKGSITRSNPGKLLIIRRGTAFRSLYL
jgi:hypothetical protein